MKLSDIKFGMKLTAVGDYAGCIKQGDHFEVAKCEEDGTLAIICRNGRHRLDEEMVHENGDIPELELLKPN